MGLSLHLSVHGRYPLLSPPRTRVSGVESSAGGVRFSCLSVGSSLPEVGEGLGVSRESSTSCLGRPTQGGRTVITLLPTYVGVAVFSNQSAGVCVRPWGAYGQPRLSGDQGTPRRPPTCRDPWRGLDWVTFPDRV